MAIWENIPLDKRESIINTLYRFERIQNRKSKINNLFNDIRKEIK